MYRLASATLRAAGFEHYEVSNYAAPGHRCAHNLCYWRNGAWYAFGASRAASQARRAVRARRRACCALTSRARTPGVAAASHVDGHRFTRPRRLRDYLAWVSAGGEASDAAARAAPGAAREAREELLLDTLMLVRAQAGRLGCRVPAGRGINCTPSCAQGLRLADGVDLHALRRQFGEPVANAVVAALAPHAPERVALCSADGNVLSPQNVAAAPGGVHAARLTVPDGFMLSNSLLSDVFARLPPVAPQHAP